MKPNNLKFEMFKVGYYVADGQVSYQVIQGSSLESLSLYIWTRGHISEHIVCSLATMLEVTDEPLRTLPPSV